MQALQVDVVIVGAGPAGVGTALSLLKHRANSRILIIERSDLESERIGEQVSDSIFDLLDYLDITQSQFNDNCFLPAYDSIAYWGSDKPVLREMIATAGGRSFQIDRKHFEQKLLLLFSERGGMLLPRSRCTKIDFDSIHNCWNLEVANKKLNDLLVNCQFLVNATGRSGSLSGRMHTQKIKHDGLTGIGAFFDISNCDNITSHQLIETTEQGWWYSASLPNKRRCVTLFTDADLIASCKLQHPDSWQDMLMQSHHMKHYLSDSKPLSYRPWIKPAYTFRVDTITATNCIPVGDAALAVDPIASSGIGFAISSGCQAGLLIHLALEQKIVLELSEYLIDLQLLYNQHLQYQQRYYARETRWKDAIFWQRRIGRDA